MRNTVYRWLRRKGAFEHGGTMHSDEHWNNLLAYGNVSNVQGMPEIVYTKPNQKFWASVLRVYNKLGL